MVFVKADIVATLIDLKELGRHENWVFSEVLRHVIRLHMTQRDLSDPLHFQAVNK